MFVEGHPIEDALKSMKQMFKRTELVVLTEGSQASSNANIEAKKSLSAAGLTNDLAFAILG